MARERWLIDGWDMTEGTVRDVETREGLYGSPEMVGANSVVSGRRGTVWRPKTYGEGAFILTGWMGAYPRTAVDSLWDQMMKVIGHPERLLTIERYMASGEVRVCSAEVLQRVAPRAFGQGLMRFDLGISVPDGVWRSPIEFQDVFTNLTNNMSCALVEQEPGTAANDELRYTFTGPMSNPGVADVRRPTTEWFRYTGNVPATATLTVDALTGLVSGTGFTPSQAALSRSGGAVLTVPPVWDGPPAVRFTGTGLTSASKMVVQGKRLFLT